MSSETRRAQAGSADSKRLASHRQGLRAGLAITMLASLLLVLGPGQLAAQAVSSSARQPLILTEKGLGPITGTTPFEQKLVQSLLPGLRVTPGQGAFEDETFPILKIADAGGLLATLNPQSGKLRIYSIVVSSNRVHNQLGPGIGTSYAAIYARGQKAGCVAGQEQLSDTVSCPAPGSKHIHYQFSGDIYGHYGEVPPEAVLQRWHIQLIYWLP